MQAETGAKPKRLAGAEIVKAAELVNYQQSSIVSREIVKQKTGNLTLFAFDEDQGLSEHTALFDALVYALEGEAEIDIAGKDSRLHCGEMILIPAHQPHSLRALTRFKMMLTMIRS
ncbi:MAG: cupin domain-containing protein [Methylomonas sp.]